MKVLSHIASPCCLPQVFLSTHTVPLHPTIIAAELPRHPNTGPFAPYCLPLSALKRTAFTWSMYPFLPVHLGHWGSLRWYATVCLNVFPYTHPGLQNSGLRPQKVLQTQQEVLPCILPPPSDKVKVSTHGGDGCSPTATVNPLPGLPPQPRNTLSVPALLTGRRVRRPPPRSRCLAPGSCHRGPPELAAPPQPRGSGHGDTRQGPGCLARPRDSVSHTLRPWPA